MAHNALMVMHGGLSLELCAMIKYISSRGGQCGGFYRVLWCVSRAASQQEPLYQVKGDLIDGCRIGYRQSTNHIDPIHLSPAR